MSFSEPNVEGYHTKKRITVECELHPQIKRIEAMEKINLGIRDYMKNTNILDDAFFNTEQNMSFKSIP